jgi:hypothetical protein
MSDAAPDLVEQLHRAAVQRCWEEKERGRALVEEAHREAVERQRADHKRLDELIDRLHGDIAAQAIQAALTALPAAPPTIHFTELPEAKPDSPLCCEWNTYRREVGRLLAAGNEGRHVLVKGDQIIGLWDSHEAAMTAAYQQFFGQPFLVHEVKERERVLRCVTMYPWRNLPLPSRPAS